MSTFCLRSEHEIGDNGLLVPFKNAAALADTIQPLIEDLELRSRMGQTGRALAEEAFAIEKIVQQHIDIYQEMENIGLRKYSTEY